MNLEEIFARKGIITIARELSSSTGQGQTIRKLALRTGMSPSEASIVARRMKALGIIRLNPAGKAFIVSLNKENYIWQRILKPILEAEAAIISKHVGTEQASKTVLTRKISESADVKAIAKWLRKRLRREGNKIISAVLYGDLKSESVDDIYLYIYFKDENEVDLFGKVEDELKSKFKVQLGGLIGAPSELKDEFKIIAKHVKIVQYELLVGADPWELLRRTPPSNTKHNYHS